MNFSSFWGQRNSGVFLSHSYHKLVETTFRPSYSTSRNFSCLSASLCQMLPVDFEFLIVLGVREAENYIWSKVSFGQKGSGLSCQCKTFTQTSKAERKRSISCPVTGVGSHANR